MDTLENKSYKETTLLSRYNNIPYYYHRLDDKYISGTTYYLKDTTLYTLHVIKQGDTFDTLALRYYKNPTLYWVICSYNHIQDPFEPLVAGQTIKIPTLSNIEFDVD